MIDDEFVGFERDTQAVGYCARRQFGGSEARKINAVTQAGGFELDVRFTRCDGEIGPFALMDLVTSRLCLQVQEILQDAYGERFRPPALLKQRVAAGFTGGHGRPGWIAPGS